MRTTFSQVFRYLSREAHDLGQAQLDELQGALDGAKVTVAGKSAKLQEALAQAEAVARAAGVSLEDLVKAAKPAPAKARARDSRKPYMDPFDANSVPVALRPNTRWPAWATTLIGQGWDISELRYDAHVKALKARGMPVLYDAVARYKQLTQ
jgi:hypothetical protein